MASVKEAVKASLVGSTPEEPQLSQQVKVHFTQHARKDEQSGELYMTEEEFIDAIAPKHQDYVSCHNPSPLGRTSLMHRPCCVAQDQT
jgi:solute carrier family 25 aspartate/glutamate transporter 12/13